MERLQYLISKLNEQNQQKESPLQMLVTLKHIEAELTILHNAGGSARSNPGVSVVMPTINVASRRPEIPVAAVINGSAIAVPRHFPVAEQQPEPLPEKTPEPLREPMTEPVPEAVVPVAPAPEVAAPVAAAVATTSSPTLPYRNGASVSSPRHTSPAAEAMKKYQPQPALAVPDRLPRREPAMAGSDSPAPQSWSVDPLMEVPTLSHQPGAPELNDIIGLRNPSINDRLKDTGMTEKGYSLKGAPVKELRKAIGVNDRYLFINELFRGDEAMYERSIKTINNFRILPEAQYWMERELKIKIGWDDSRDIVQHFYELVSRRFS